MIEDYFKFALEGILHRKLRSWLTIIGIFIGIIAVVALISLGQGLQAFIDQQFEQVGGKRIIISPGGGGFESGASPMTSELVSAKLYQGDLETVQEVRGVKDALGMLSEMSRVKHDGHIEQITTLAIPADSETIEFAKGVSFFELGEGNYFGRNEKYKAVIGYGTSQNLFGEEIDVGDKIEIEGKEFEVEGITKESGNPFHDKRIVIPIDTGRELFGKPDQYSSLTLKVKDNFKTGEVKENIEEELREHRDVEEGEEDFSVQTSENIVESFQSVLNLVRVVLVGIASISLVVGGVGIMTTMYTSVLQRTRQIGIMKSVGAKNSDILLIFLMEAGLLGLTGGVIGVTIGMGISYGVEYLLHLYGIELIHIYISLELILGALGFSFLVGCLSGFLPARKAAKMNPVDALSYR